MYQNLWIHQPMRPKNVNLHGNFMATARPLFSTHEDGRPQPWLHFGSHQLPIRLPFWCNKKYVYFMYIYMYDFIWYVPFYLYPHVLPIISLLYLSFPKKWAYTIEEPKMAVTQFVEFKNGMCIPSNNHKP